MGIVIPNAPRPVLPTMREDEAAGNPSDVKVDKQLVGILKGGESLADVLLPTVPLREVLLRGERSDGAIGEQRTSDRVAEAMVVVFRIRSGSCLVSFLCGNQFISGTD